MANIDIKALIEEAVEKLKADPALLKKFDDEPIKVLEKLFDVDLPEDKLQPLVDGIKAKLSVDKLGDALGGLGKLFGKK